MTPELEAALKTDADMPPIESLNAGSDYAQFLSPKVSERLRRAALRKLFHLPQFNVTDGLDDYARDYRNFTPLGDVVTADMRHQMELQEKAALARLTQKIGAAAGDETPPASGASGAANEAAAEQSPPVAPPSVAIGREAAALAGADTAVPGEPGKIEG